MQRHPITACALVLALMVSIVSAQIPLNINYQARLSNHDTGEPVPDATYPVEFRFYADSTGGAPVWTENYSLPTHNGFFNARLGGMDGMNLDNLTSQLFMEVVVDGEVMIPRAPFTHVPYSAIAQRVMGDIQTGEGAFKMMDPTDDGRSGIEMLTNITDNSFKMMDPTDDGGYGIEMLTNVADYSFKMMDPTDDGGHGIEMYANSLNHGFKMMDPTDDGGQNNAIIEISGSIGGEANIFMFNPQPEPPAQILALNSSPMSGASLKMFNPQPEPPADPLLEMITNDLGASFEMTAPQTGGVGSDITNPMLRIYTTENGAGINLSDEIGRYMGFEPMPFTPGGHLYLINPSADDTNVVVDSDGNIQAKNGIFGFNIDNSGNYNLSVGAYNNLTGSYSFSGGYLAQVFHNNCFVWADYTPDIPLTTTLSGQFLVRACGGVSFYTNGTMTSGVSLSPGGSSWNAIVPPLTADNSRDIDGSDILARIEQLPIKHYNLDNENSIEHISPAAGKFNSLFNTGNDDKHISALDQSGVALAGVQALIIENRELKERITRLEEIIEKLNND